MRSKVEQLLEVYTLEEILELNDMDEIDLVLLLSENGFIKLPDIQPLE